MRKTKIEVDQMLKNLIPELIGCYNQSEFWSYKDKYGKNVWSINFSSNDGLSYQVSKIPEGCG